MIAAFKLLALTFAAAYVLWLLYLAVMNLRRAREAGTLVPRARILGMPALIVGYALDIALNVLLMSFVLWEFPRVTREPRAKTYFGRTFIIPIRIEATISARLKRHNLHSTGWRKAVALWFEPMLDPFDHTGDHI